jgi:peptidoglycan/xylan/chitin deacetylase (PgdA/CDA1 family)
MTAGRFLRAIKTPVLRLRNRSAAIILMYHRIGEPGDDPWALAVSPEHFREHLRVLRAMREVVPLRELATRLVQGKRVKRLAALTFDDGYADNLYHAKPLLEENRIPATVFVTTHGMGSGRWFWWDELISLVPAVARLCPTLRVEVDGVWHEWRLDAGEGACQVANAAQKWRAWETPLSGWRRAYIGLWRLLRSSPPPQIEDVLRQLREITGRLEEECAAFSILSRDELRSLAASEGVEVGAHGVTHVSLRDISPDLCRVEIERSKKALEEQLDAPVRTFAYPFGEWSDAAVAVLRDAGFLCACTTRHGVTRPSSDPFRLPRLHVQDWDAPSFERALAALVTGRFAA